MEAREASDGKRVHTDPAQACCSSNNNPRPPNKSRELPTSSTLHSRENQFPNPMHLLWWTSLLNIFVKGFLTPQAERKFFERRIAVLFVYELIINLQIARVTTNAGTTIHQVIINPCDRNKNDAAKQEPSPSGATETSTTRATTTVAALSKKGTVLLQTARAVAFNEDGTKTKDVRILCDNGSQWRMIITVNFPT